MTSYAISPLDVSTSPGRPPMLLADPGGDSISWTARNRDQLRAVVHDQGAVLVRGLGIGDATGAGALFRVLATPLLDQTETFATRSQYSDRVYASTPWPPGRPMCMHHEFSYRDPVPGLMIMACLTAPTSGGATGLANASAVLEALPQQLIRRFERDGWLLTRTYTDEIGATLVDAFGTDDRSAIEAYCRNAGIEYAWSPDVLRTRQRRPAIVRHPVTGARCWSNQVAFLNEWTLEPEVREFLVDSYGPDGLPFNTAFGDGSPIEAEVIDELNAVYQATTVETPWQQGDLLLIDNIATAHSREPYTGKREIVVALAEPVRLSGVAR
jgi:alpha-ketoglutarate-dependent taurine dioxygenase